MAPRAPTAAKEVARRIRAGQLPVSFGSPHPFMMALEQDGVFRIRELIIDPADAAAASAAALARGGPWMPEQYYALGRPTGKVHAEAATRKQLADRVEAMAWPADW